MTNTENISIEVTISMTWSKTITVKVPRSYDRVDLYEAAQDKVFDDIQKLQNNEWIENEFEVIKE